MRYKLFLFWILFFCARLFSSPSQFYEVVEQNNQYIVIRFHFPDPEISRNSPASRIAAISLPGMNYSYEDSVPLLPVFSKSIIAPPGKVSVSILTSEQEFYPGIKPPLHLSQQTISDQALLDYQPFLYPKRVIVLRETGLFRDYRLMALQVFPLQLTPDGVRFYRKLEVKIRFFGVRSQRAGSSAPSVSLASAEKRIFSHLALNGNMVDQIPPAVSKPLNPPNKTLGQTAVKNRVKIFVNKRGIYHVTGKDLKDADVNIDNIDPQTLKLTNKGNDIHILVVGDQDHKLDPGDYFEFWGEKNEKTFLNKYSDVYNDPFSDENVYWLSWGGTPGVRMVEESGAIVQTNPSLYNPAPFYPFTVHAEKDGKFERLGYGNTHNLTYKQDSWFFDSGIQAISKKDYPINLIYPDSSSFNPVEVTIKMTGKSQTSHHTMVWLNQQLVGETTNDWFLQNVYTLKTSPNTSLWSADLMHGTNELEIQMPSLAPGGKSDYILFNWADITYDRQYKAYNNYINFTRPSPSVINYPNITLFQFEISNFTRSDIEVYKKGLSKIVNFGLEAQTSGNHPRFKIVFQDEILSDEVEYIAMTSDLKLKPVLIEPDEPFDPQNPSLSLKDPSNSADYLIITHPKFYKRAQNYADYRRQQGLNVVMVNVDDIYDEFNYGIKSPLAIQSFLKYAFYNWDRTHRLKYVLLLGDANFNYKSHSSTFEDFVPTFFFQTKKFGAVASDFPYSLIAGDDYIPDLFVGRIPVMTNGDISIILDKLQEYEQNPIIGPWRNQALFVSGNDRSTYEFSSYVYNAFKIPKRPAFRTQNQRVINMLLPKQYTAFKLNTVKDDSVQYDPNFGGTTDLIDYFDNGVNFMNFLGHGGGAIWADVQLLNLRDIDRLNNKGKYPFVASMTCFTGAFDNPGNPGLAQKLLLTRDKGAIGLIASSGLAWVANDYAMLWNVMQELFSSNISVGEAISIAKIDYFETGQYITQDTLVPGNFWGHSSIKLDMIYQYNLLGDPYISLEAPEQNVQINVDKTLLLPGDTINVQILAPFTAAEGYFELTNGNNDVIFREPVFLSGGQLSRQVVIPTDFPKGQGFLRAYLAENEQDGVGVRQIAVNSSLFDSVQTIPAIPNAEDSVAVELRALDRAGITGVRVVAFVPQPSSFGDTIIYKLPTQQIAPNVFRTVGKIPPTFALRNVYYTIYATNTLGEVSKVSYHYKVFEDRPDPLIYKNRIRLVGTEQVKLGISIGNSGEVAAQNVELKIYNGRSNFQSDQPFATLPVSVDGKDSLTIQVDFPFPLNVNEYQIYAALDRNAQSEDFNRLNNTDSAKVRINMFNVTPALGTTYDNVKNDTIRIGGFDQFHSAPGTISNASAMIFDISPLKGDLAKTNLTPVPLMGFSGQNITIVQLLNPQAQFSAPYYLKIFYDKQFVDSTVQDLDNLRLFGWDERAHAWIQKDASLDTAAATLTVRSTETGLFAPFISTDVQPPRIELTVEGRHIRSKALVSSNPILNVVLEDESGINIHKNQVQVLIDGIPVQENKMFMPDSVDQSKIFGFTLYPELANGQYNMTIKVKDVNGNSSQKEYTLRVDDQFDMHVFGNYPNPFSDFTIFSYFLTKELDELEIRVFTVSGRLIRRIENDVNTLTPGNDPKRIGYGELMWDGRDEDGNEVANGVYFVVIRGKYNDEIREETLRVAKLK